MQQGLSKGERKCQPMVTALVSTGTGRGEQGALISAPSIQIGVLVGGAGWFTLGEAHQMLGLDDEIPPPVQTDDEISRPLPGGV